MDNLDSYQPIDWNTNIPVDATLYTPFNPSEPHYYCYSEHRDDMLSVTPVDVREPSNGLVFAATDGATGQTMMVTVDCYQILGLAQYLRGYSEYCNKAGYKKEVAAGIAAGVRDALTHVDAFNSQSNPSRAVEALTVGLESGMARIYGK